MIDLHSHVLPGIDDGASDWHEAIEMCRRAAAGGCSAILATPHLRHPRYWNGDKAMLETLCGELAERLEGVIDVHLGGEITLHSESYEELDLLPDGELTTLAGSRYVLIELDWHGYGPDPLEVVHELQVSGWTPIIAHPERVSWVASDPHLPGALVRGGALFQLTAMSLTGELGSRLQDVSTQMIDAGLVHFVASDAHDLRQRPPGLEAARNMLTKRWGDELARRLLVDNPAAVLQNRPLESTIGLTR